MDVVPSHTENKVEDGRMEPSPQVAWLSQATQT